MENKEVFDALIAKMKLEQNPSREDILAAISYLNDREIDMVYTFIEGQLKKE